MRKAKVEQSAKIRKERKIASMCPVNGTDVQCILGADECDDVLTNDAVFPNVRQVNSHGDGAIKK